MTALKPSRSTYSTAVRSGCVSSAVSRSCWNFSRLPSSVSGSCMAWWNSFSPNASRSLASAANAAYARAKSPRMARPMIQASAAARSRANTLKPTTSR